MKSFIIDMACILLSLMTTLTVVYLIPDRAIPLETHSFWEGWFGGVASIYAYSMMSTNLRKAWKKAD